MLLTHALAFSASKFVHKKTSPRIYTGVHSGGFELTKLTYTGLEDNLIRHRGDRGLWEAPLRNLDLKYCWFPEDRNLMKNVGLNLTHCINITRDSAFNITTDNVSNTMKAAEHSDLPDRHACAERTIELNVKRLVGSAAFKGAEEVVGGEESEHDQGRGIQSAGAAE